MRGLLLALFSGFLAACASVCGKISMTTDEPLLLCETVLDNLYPEDFIDYISSFSSNYDYNHPANRMTKFERRLICLNMKVLIIVRVVFLMLMVAFNAIMWISFTKALVLCPTTISATLINTAANFFSSAVFGMALFGERPGRIWWLGTMLIASGLWVMHSQMTPEHRITHRRGTQQRRPKTS